MRHSTLPAHCTLDGEIVAVRDGRAQFSALLGRLARRADSQIQFLALDILELERDNLTALSLRERRNGLVSVVPDRQSSIRATVQTEMLEVAEDWLSRARELDIEGVVAKRLTDPLWKTLLGQGQALGNDGAGRGRLHGDA